MIDILHYGIMVVRQALEKDICEFLISSADIIGWKPLEVFENGKENSFEMDRNTRLGEGTSFQIGSEQDKILEKLFWSNIQEHYLREYYHLRGNRDRGYSMIRYKKGGFYKEHIDNADPAVSSRVVTGILYLSDDYEGGELEFPKQDCLIKPDAGDLVFFPANYLYPHICRDIESGEKHIAVCFFENSMSK